MLELRNITKRFGDVLANDRVSIKVTPGTVHAIVGENGAGKSTAMRIAYGFYTADSGEIVIDGQVREVRTPHDSRIVGKKSIVLTSAVHTWPSCATRAPLTSSGTRMPPS